MDSKNVLLAVVLSTLVLVLWAVFFEPPVIEKNKFENEIVENNQEESSPSIETKKTLNVISRNESLEKVDRIKLENENIKGSISLEGGVIDDIIFKNYNESLEDEKKVIFLNPKNSDKGYYIETGWAVSGEDKSKLPLDNTVWKVKGNTTLTPNNPVLLEWSNNEGLVFTKKIELDDKFLFKITQSIKNNSKNSFQFFPYAQITRNYKPEVTPIYILHEGFIGVFEDQLEEMDYEDIDKKKFVIKKMLKEIIE